MGVVVVVVFVITPDVCEVVVVIVVDAEAGATVDDVTPVVNGYVMKAVSDSTI